MLRHLRISNLVLIHDAELELVPGLNAITGETGAGKTIFTNAIGLLLGARGDAGLIGAAGAEAYVEAEFDRRRRRARSARWPSSGPTARRVSCSRAGSSPTGARAPTPGAGARRARTSPPPPRPARDERPVRAAAPRAARVPARRARRVRRNRRSARRSSAWRELQAARRAYDELTQNAADAGARLAELQALAEDTAGLDGRARG